MKRDFWDSIGDKITFKIFGNRIDIESKLNKLISDFGAVFYIKTKNYDNTVSIDVSILSDKDKRKLITQIFRGLEDRIYSDYEVDISVLCIELLKFTNKKVGVAESITGGLIANSIISISGASEVFNEGLVCYSNVAKMKVLGVKSDTLAFYTAVSSQTAYEMACGLLNHSYNDFAIATTGYAENYGGEKNGGKVFIGVGSRERIDVHEYKFEGDRDTVRLCATNAALFHLIKKLKGSFDFIR